MRFFELFLLFTVCILLFTRSDFVWADDSKKQDGVTKKETNIEDEIFGLDIEFDLEPPPKTSARLRLAEIVEMEHGYYGDMIIHGQKIKMGRNIPAYFYRSAFDGDFNLYGSSQGFHFNEIYPKTSPYNPEGGIPNDVREQMKLSDVRQHFMDVDRKHFSHFMDIDYIVENIKGVPKHNVLNRWEKDTITVSIITDETYYSEPNVDDIIHEELFNKIKSLNEKTNLNIVYEEGLGKKADIIFLFGLAAETLMRSSMGYVPKIDQVLYGVVRFPGGYILPNHNNEIIKAYCSIHVPQYFSHKELLTPEEKELVENVIDEQSFQSIRASIEICLLRSLGLTGEVDKKGLMFVNYAEPFSALTKIPDKKVSKGELVFEPKEIAEIRNKVMAENEDFFMFDLIVLKLLYCDLYKPQMDLNEAQFYFPSCYLQGVDFREKDQKQ